MTAGRANWWLLALGVAVAPAPAVAQEGTRSAGLRRPAIDSMLAEFYDRRSGRLAWSDAGVISPQSLALFRTLEVSAADGLDPADYAVAAIDSVPRPGAPFGDYRRFDSVLTAAFLRYGRDVSGGRVKPAAVDSQWQSTPPAVDLVRLLEAAVNSDGVARALHVIPPRQPGYLVLRRALAAYRAIAGNGGWPALADGPSLMAGVRAARVAVVRARLAMEGYAVGADSGADRFDDVLDAAIRKFQRHHGLTPDGVVGAATRVALNVSAAARARQIALNLERWRWLPRGLGERYIMVNSPAFTLDVVEQGRSVLRMRAIVGLPDRPTPIATSRVTDLLFRPVWWVPHTIAADEILPLARRDPDYFTRLGMRVFADSAAGGRELDPATIDWTAVTESTFAYQMAQEPGPANPLGGVKLVFWTPFNVFIHDSPARPLFSARLRAFSHGCVRVEGAAPLAAYLLPGWSEDSIHRAMTVGRDRRIRLNAQIPVHLVYFTAWVDDDGVVEFRNDVYGWDERLRRALAPVPAMPLWIP